MSDTRERLLALETDGRFLFHGSPILVEKLIPKQPTNFDKKTGKEERHGDPCVAATNFAEIAIFRAIINPRNFPDKGYGSSFGMTSKENVRLTVKRRVWQQRKGKMGYVYVFSLNGFSRFSRMEWRSECEVKPLEVITVSVEDLPKNIKVKWW